MADLRQPLFTEATATRDAAWVQKAVAGDADAFGQLVAAYERPAVATAYRLLGNSDDARDIAQLRRRIETEAQAARAIYRRIVEQPARDAGWTPRTKSGSKP